MTSRGAEITRLGFLALALGSCATASGDAPPPDWLSDFVDLFYRQKNVRVAFERYVGEDYIQHSAGIGAGRAAAIAVLEPMFARASFSAEPVRVVMDGDLAIVLLRVAAGEVRAFVVDIFRFSGAQIVEHWDVKVEIPPADTDRYFAGLR